MSSELLKKLKEVKKQSGGINPDRLWVAKNRAELLSTIKQANTAPVKENTNSNPNFIRNVSEGINIFVSQKILGFARVAMTSLLAFAVAAGGWTASVSASYNSLPGEILYGVKMATEATELMVTKVVGSEKDEVSTILKHASSRVDEYQRSKSSEQATEAIKSLKKKIEASDAALDKAEKKSPEKAVVVAKVIEEKTDEILYSLTKDTQENKKASVSTKQRLKNKKQGHIESQKELATEIDEAENLIEKTSTKAVEMIVTKVESKEVGEDVITKEEVKKTIAKKLNKIVSDVTKMDVEMEEKTQLMASSTISVILETVTSTEEVVEENEDVVEESTEEVIEENESTNSTELESAEKGVIEEVIVEKTIEEKVEDAEQKIEEVSKKIEEAVEDVGNFIEQDKLSAALEKIKELESAKSETKVAVVKASDAVDEVVESAGEEAEEVVEDVEPEIVLISEEVEEEIVEEENTEEDVVEEENIEEGVEEVESVEATEETTETEEVVTEVVNN